MLSTGARSSGRRGRVRLIRCYLCASSEQLRKDGIDAARGESLHGSHNDRSETRSSPDSDSDSDLCASRQKAAIDGYCEQESCIAYAAQKAIAEHRSQLNALPGITNALPPQAPTQEELDGSPADSKSLAGAKPATVPGNVVPPLGHEKLAELFTNRLKDQTPEQIEQIRKMFSSSQFWK